MAPLGKSRAVVGVPRIWAANVSSGLIFLQKKKNPAEIYSHILEARSPRPRCWQRWFLLEALRGNLVHASPCCWCTDNFWHFLAFRCITVTSASVVTWPSPCVSVSRFPLLSWGHQSLNLGTTLLRYDLILTELFATITTYFQMSSRSEFLRVHEFEEPIQCFFVPYVRNLCSSQSHEDILPFFPSENTLVLTFHFIQWFTSDYLLCMWWVRKQGSFFSLVDIQLFQHLVLKRLAFPHLMTWHFHLFLEQSWHVPWCMTSDRVKYWWTIIRP